jgi:pimeloyl-ACP methyl ester carboxylesterase
LLVLPRITIPVLFITGRRDEIAPMENAYQMVAAVRSHGTQIAELAASHATHRDAPTDYEQAVLALMARILPDDAGVIGAR